MQYVFKDAKYNRPLEDKVKDCEHFYYWEFVASQTAYKLKIVNRPLEEHWKNLEKLAKEALEPIREHFGPIQINSGYRGSELNKAVNGSVTSNHCKGLAVDIEAVDKNISNAELLKWIYDNIDFYELIAEKFGKNPRDGWVHLAYNGTRRESGLKLLETGSKMRLAKIEEITDKYLA